MRASPLALVLPGETLEDGNGSWLLDEVISGTNFNSTAEGDLTHEDGLEGMFKLHY